MKGRGIRLMEEILPPEFQNTPRLAAHSFTHSFTRYRPHKKESSAVTLSETAAVAANKTWEGEGKMKQIRYQRTDANSVQTIR